MDGSQSDTRPDDHAPENPAAKKIIFWRAFGASVVGHSHISRGLGNQDAVHWYPADDGLDNTGLPAIIAVSDGHGETACVRSDRGARFAVEIAVDVLRQFASDMQLRGGNEVADVKEFAPRLLHRPISERWTARVLADCESKPFSPGELLRLIGTEESPADGVEQKKKLKAYGCTILAVLATPSFLVGLQVGDGAIAIAYPDGESRLLIPPHKAHFGNETTSLCSDPVDMAVDVLGLEKGGPVVVMACTDGYEKAIDTEYFRCTLLGEYVECFRKRYGWREIYKDLPGMLEDATNKGSGDDATAAFLVSSVLEDPASEADALPSTRNKSIDKTHFAAEPDCGNSTATSIASGRQHDDDQQPPIDSGPRP